MRERNRKPIASYYKFPQFTTMNVIDGQAVINRNFSLIFYSLTIDNILNIIVLLILAGVTIAMLSGENGILSRATETNGTNAYYSAEEQVRLAYMTVKTEIMAERTSNGTYNAQEHGSELAGKVSNELKGTEWTKVEYNETSKAIEITFENSAIKAESIEGGSNPRPSQNGQVEYEITLTAKDAKLSKIDGYDTGTASSSEGGIGGGDEPIEPTPIGTSVTELREGDEVVYTAGDGTEIPCIVLYDSTGEYGIQVISKKVLTSVTLWNFNRSTNNATQSEFNTARNAYNTAVASLNMAANDFLNTDLSENNGARCAGTHPGIDPILAEDPSVGGATNVYDDANCAPGLKSLLSTFKPSDLTYAPDGLDENRKMRYKWDYGQMVKLDCAAVENEPIYYLGCRETDSRASGLCGRLIGVYQNGKLSGLSYAPGLWPIGWAGRLSGGVEELFAYSSYDLPIRCVFKLKTNIHYEMRDGSKVLIE